MLMTQAASVMMQVQHYYADDPAFPGYMHNRTTAKYMDMHYHYQRYISPSSQAVVLQKETVLVS